MKQRNSQLCAYILSQLFDISYFCCYWEVVANKISLKRASVFENWELEFRNSRLESVHVRETIFFCAAFHYAQNLLSKIKYMYVSGKSKTEFCDIWVSGERRELFSFSILFMRLLGQNASFLRFSGFSYIFVIVGHKYRNNFFVARFESRTPILCFVLHWYFHHFRLFYRYPLRAPVASFPK